MALISVLGTLCASTLLAHANICFTGDFVILIGRLYT